MLELYHHGSSVCAAKVRFALAEKGLEWTGHYLDILKGDQFDSAYMALNPKAVVPTFVHDGRVLVESTAICEYIDETFPNPPLMPKDAYLRHQVRLWTKAVDEELHPACGVVTFAVSHRHTVARLGKAELEEFLSKTPAQSVTANWKAWKRQVIEHGLDTPLAVEKLQLYDAYLRKMNDALMSKDWIACETFSLADIGLAPYVNRLAAMGMSPMWEGGRYPRVEDWFRRIVARPTFNPTFVDWMPQSLTEDLNTNGRRSWPEIAAILSIAA
ncbi:MAG: glutathione S-transferase family protein [Chloroflexi bacterium]|nr:glutathione S-transferase family protein [Chloroflexota bacterium]